MTDETAESNSNNQKMIEKAATLAAEWWKPLLHSNHEDKRAAFAECIKRKCIETLNERPAFHLEVDYDPQGIMLEVVRETIDPECRGWAFSALGILPYKHDLYVSKTELEPKAGYGNWTDKIKVSIDS